MTRRAKPAIIFPFGRAPKRRSHVQTHETMTDRAAPCPSVRPSPAFPAMVALALWLGLAPTPASAAEGPPLLFQTEETRSENLAPFKKWVAAVERALAEKAKASGSCADPKLNACHYARWMAFLDGLKGKDKMAQMAEVNQYFNKTKYIEDQPNWSIEDYWASPTEFLQKSGDCEDYAIIKFMSLKMLGFDPDSLRITAVQDLNLKVGHAILAVYMGPKIYILDNQIKEVIEDKKIRHYQPVFSINERAWWRHKKT